MIGDWIWDEASEQQRVLQEAGAFPEVGLLPTNSPFPFVKTNKNRHTIGYILRRESRLGDVKGTEVASVLSSIILAASID